MTLIEVLAALALLGSLAVAMVLSRGRLVEQHARAQQKLDAVRAADDLIAQWWAGDLSALPVGEEGPIAGHPNWRWEMRAIERRELRPFDACVVRLRIVEKPDTVGAVTIELTSVDLVLPVATTPSAPGGEGL